MRDRDILHGLCNLVIINKSPSICKAGAGLLFASSAEINSNFVIDLPTESLILVRLSDDDDGKEMG